MGKAIKKVAGIAKKLSPFNTVIGAPLAALEFGKKALGGGGPSGGAINAITNIEGSTEAAKRAGELEKESGERSKKAQGQRQELITDLQAQAKGEGPSLAEAQLRSGSERNLAQQLAAAASQTGGSPAAVQRQLAQQQSESGQQIASESAETRIQEQQIAREQLGQQIAQEQQLSDQLTQGFLQQGFDIQQARQQALAQIQIAKQQSREAARGRESGLLGSIIGGGASILASDERAKENVKSGKKDVNKFLNALSAKSYDYTNPEFPGRKKGRRYGIMAQDLEKSEMGASFVEDTPFGKVVDTKQGFGAVLAAMSELNERTQKLEKKNKKRRK